MDEQAVNGVLIVFSTLKLESLATDGKETEVPEQEGIPTLAFPYQR